MKDIIRVAVPIRHRSLFDYVATPLPAIGSRVVVPFGRRRFIGIVVEHADTSEYPLEKLRTIHTVLDETPALSRSLMRTLQWVAEYYQQPIGEVLSAALPKTIRLGRSVQPKVTLVYQLTEAGRTTEVSQLARARVQQQILALLKVNSSAPPTAFKQISPNWRHALKALQVKGLIQSKVREFERCSGPGQLLKELTEQQAYARRQLIAALGRYQCFLLQGVTGSGKTEVYLQVIAEVIARGGQALMLVPEIGLSPQLVERVQMALGERVTEFHSGLTDTQRHQAWWLALNGDVKVVIGTRSAVFLPFSDLQLIVMDEEHDSSFKQQDRVCYHARTVALHRGVTENVPVIFGTATPSLETIQAARTGRAQALLLSERATRIEMPTVKVIDLSQEHVQNGLSVTLINQIKDRIMAGEQSLIFINRRGFAPIVVCLTCQWTATCAYCDARLIFHQTDQRLHCHLCLRSMPVMNQCPNCQSGALSRLGVGTQRVEQELQYAIPGARVLRIDRDTTTSYREFERKLERIQQGEVDILVGTQMLSKGHHFPNVTLVGVLNVDQAFYSMDFRAMEHLVQQVQQVAGRSGRANKPGAVYIQTMHPESEYFDCIRQHDYLSFATLELTERRQAGQPPFAHYALLRANSLKPGEELNYLEKARNFANAIAEQQNSTLVHVFDILQSPIQKISNRYRAQMLVSSAHSASLKRFLRTWMPQLEKIPKKGQLRWNLDVDPIDFS